MVEIAPTSNGTSSPSTGSSDEATSSSLDTGVHSSGSAYTTSPPPPPMMPSNGYSLDTDEDRDARLLDLTERTGYSLVQRNGQRIFGGPPPDWTGPPPGKGCEIFVGKVPRNCIEADLVPLFAPMGRIYELRLMMDFSGSNRGYFFVRYCKRDDAKRAVFELNNYEIAPRKRLGVLLSVDNRKLWISGIPKNRSAYEIKAEMARLTEGVRNVILYPSQTDKSKTRGYAFVEYETHRAAALARRTLVPKKNYLFGQEIEKVDWAEPEQEVDEETMSKVCVLFLRNLQPCTTEIAIRRTFEDLGEEELERVKKNKDYAFVHFKTREAAELAMDRCTSGDNNLIMDNVEVEVTWSKPVDKNTHNQRKYLTKFLSGQMPGPGSVNMPYREGPYMNHLPPNMGVPPFGAPNQDHYNMPFGTGANGTRLLAPRKRGAAGIRGLGAPGTAPSRRLLKMTGPGFNNAAGPIGSNPRMMHSGYDTPPQRNMNNGGNGAPPLGTTFPFNMFHPQQQQHPMFYPPPMHQSEILYQQHQQSYFTPTMNGLPYLPGSAPPQQHHQQANPAHNMLPGGGGPPADVNVLSNAMAALGVTDEGKMMNGGNGMDMPTAKVF